MTTNNLKTPLQDLNGQIFFIFDDNRYINSIWHDKNNVNDLEEAILHERNKSNELNVCQLILTPQASNVIDGILFPCCYPSSLKIMNKSIDLEFLDQIINTKNIIITDFIKSEFIRKCLNENIKRLNNLN
jgi:hypothetical protein